MKYGVFAGFLVAAAAWPGTAEASLGSATGGIPVALNLFILVGSIACLAAAIKLFLLVKGGALARGWQLLVLSFITLTLAQVIVLAEKLGIMAITFDVAGVFYLLTVGLWFWSLLQTRKVLE
ncbi:MAG: hypothetical protein PHR28_02970 [candidate division Zixibacteria bacterium]|nr:hypothetical protein [candidate division Zixibacteria bacterium]